MIVCSSVLSFLSPFILLVSASVVTVDPSLSNLLTSNSLPTPHPDLTVIVSRELVGAGFHRTLLSRVEQVATAQSTPGVVGEDADAVVVALVENITCDVYVDVDQVCTIIMYVLLT